MTPFRAARGRSQTARSPRRRPIGARSPAKPPRAVEWAGKVGEGRAGAPRWSAAAIATILALVAAGLATWWAAARLEPPATADAPPAGAAVAEAALPLPDQPSIAVLPFENLSGDAKQESFVDAITDNVITELSRFSGLFVIARNSVFTYKGKPVKVQQVAEDLGVQYVLEGSVQRSGDQMRVTADLIDAWTGRQVWGERYDRETSDIFAVQDEVTHEIVARLGGSRGEVAEAATKRAKRKGPVNLGAYETYLLAVEYKHRFTKENNAVAAQLFTKAIKLDPYFARAYSGLAWTHYHEVWEGWSNAPEESLDRGFEAARTAIDLDPSDAEPRWALADLHLLARQYEEALVKYEEALALNPNYADIIADWGWLMYLIGKPEEAIEPVRKALRLNPNNPSWYEWNLGAALYFTYKYEEAISTLRSAKQLIPIARLYLAASYAQLGRSDEARVEAAYALQEDPEATVESVGDLEPFKNSSSRDHFREGMRKAGLPLCATEKHLTKYPNMERLPECDVQRARAAEGARNLELGPSDL